MALFKISKGTKANLNSQTLTEGYCWFTPEDGKFYIDAFKNGVLTRIPLNAAVADSVAWTNVTGRPGDATSTKGGILTDAQAVKLAGIATGAEVNQNAFSNIKIGSTTVAADAKTDTVEFTGSNITISGDATNDKVTFSLTKANVTTALGYTPPTTNTTYDVATQSANGLMSSTDKKKLDGIATGAEVNQNAFSNVKVGNSTVAADAKTDTLELAGSNVTLTPDTTNDKITIGITSANVISALGYTPPQQDTTYSNATTSAAGLMSADDKTKLNGIATGAEVNQNAFGKVKVGSTTVEADAKIDTLELVGSNVTITPDATNDKVTIGITKTNVTTALGYTPPTQDTTYSNATQSASGLMSSDDKTKLDGISTGAEVNQNAFSTVAVLASGSGTATNVAADSKTDTLTLAGSSTVTLTGDATNDKVTFSLTKANVTTALGYTPPTTNTTYSNATTSAAGLMSADDKTKLNGIATGAEVNQNAFSNIKVGSTTVAADAKTDTVEFVGSNVTITPDATNDKVTFSLTSSNVTTALGYTPPQQDTTYSAATQSAAGLMSAADKKKLDGIATGAQVNVLESVTASGTAPLTLTAGSISNKSIAITGSIATVSSTSAGVAPKGAAVSTQSQTTKFLREDGTWAAPSYTTNTNNAVTQTNTTTSGNYRVLMSSTADDTTRTEGARKSGNLQYNPSTNLLSTGNLQLTGELNVTGNATLSNETYADSLTAGSLLVNGDARFTTIPNSPTPAADSNDTSIATTAFVMNAFTANDAMVFKGVINANSSLPATHKQGWTYRIGTAGTYAGKVCEVGDIIICVTDGTAASNDHWAVIQNNVDGAVYRGTNAFTDANIIVADSTAGKVKSSGKTITTTAPGSSSADTTIPTSKAVWSAITSASGYGKTGTVTQVTAGTGLSIGTTAGGSITSTGTINHTNSVTAQTTQALYPIKIDAQGHISAYGTAVTSLPASDVSAWAKAATKPTYNWGEISQSGANNIEEGTSNFTDNTELFSSYASNNGFADSNATGKVYRRDAIKLYNYVKTKLAVTNNNINLSRNTETTIATIGGTAIKIKLPASDNTDTKQNITLATTSKAYLTGVTTTPTSSAQALTGVADTGVYLTATAGEISAVRHSFNVSGTEKAYMVFNSTTNAIDFIFN